VRAGSRPLLLYATLCLHEIEVQSGNVPQIERLNTQLASLEVFFSMLATETLLPAQALQATWSGDFYRAYRLLEPGAEHQIDLDRRAFRHAEIALYVAAAGLRVEALAAAERALAIVRRLHSVDRTVMQTLAYVALAFVLTRRHARAAKLLARVSASGDTGDRMRIFVRIVGTLARRWSSPSASTELEGQLEELEAHDRGGLARMVEALPLPETARGRIAQLTSAERRLLGQLSKGMDPGLIASSEGRRPQRVAAQISSICRKLGCAEYSHAVAVAVNEGLLYDAAPGLQ
jgi:DNA-binding CsgD family transcriptional regulator